jgi:hypothetical protein
MKRLVFLISGLVIALVWSVSPVWAAEGNRYAVVVQGASGEPQYAQLHRAWVDALSAVLQSRMGFDPARITKLTEEPKAGELKGTAESVKATLERLAKETKPEDLVFIMLIGHGAGEPTAAKFNLVGPDLTAAEWNTLLKPIAARMVIVDSTSSSFPFLASLSSKNRIVITATNTFGQHFDTVFPDAFIKSLTATDADADKDGRLSLLEIFNATTRLVALHYEQVGYMSTEIAMLDDTGDGKGRSAAATGDDGVIAGLTYLDAPAAPKSADPETQALLLKQQALTEQIDELRRRRSSISAEEFDKEFEKLIVDLALVSRDVRRKTIR